MYYYAGIYNAIHKYYNYKYVIYFNEYIKISIKKCIIKP